MLRFVSEQLLAVRTALILSRHIISFIWKTTPVDMNVLHSKYFSRIFCLGVGLTQLTATYGLSPLSLNSESASDGRTTRRTNECMLFMNMKLMSSALAVLCQ